MPKQIVSVVLLCSNVSTEIEAFDYGLGLFCALLAATVFVLPHFDLTMVTTIGLNPTVVEMSREFALRHQNTAFQEIVVAIGTAP